MLASAIPANFPIPFANNAGGSYTHTIPTASQIGITPGAASLYDGFPPLNFVDPALGGVPFWGRDVNGILYEITNSVRWTQSGGCPRYDAALSTAIGGYPQGALLQAADYSGYWISTTDNNTTDPDTGGAGWLPFAFVGATSLTMTNANVTLTLAQYSKSIIFITGTVTTPLNLIFPTNVAQWMVVNNTTGSTITAKTAAGTGVLLPQGVEFRIYGDGTNILGGNLVGSTVTLTTGGLNTARGTVAMHATTMNLWAQPNIIDGTGSPVTVTAITNAPQAGATRTLYPIAGSIITNGATFAVDGGANVTSAAGDSWTFEAVTTSTYKVHIVYATNPVQVHIVTNSGSVVVPSGITTAFISGYSGSGGGAGGDGGNVPSAKGGGGGGIGLYGPRMPRTVSPGETLTIAIGAGGIGGVASSTPSDPGHAGNQGGTTTVTRANSTVILSIPGGAGGAAAGGSGTPSFNGALGSGAAGGTAGSGGNVTVGGTGGNGSIAGNGTSEYEPGGGGGGGSSNSPSYGGGAGGNGAPGVVFIEFI